LAAPGAVFIRGRVSKRENALISAAGPFTNIVLAGVFAVVLAVFPNGLPGLVASYGMFINSWLALFNLLPFWQMDGTKILQGNKVLYAVLAVLALAAVLVSFVG
jgi:Zn-dependent protease